MLNKSERRRLSHELQRMGLASLEDPALLQQLATIYNTHEKFRGMLMSVTPEKRAEGTIWFLSEVSTVLSSSLDYETTLASVARLTTAATTVEMTRASKTMVPNLRTLEEMSLSSKPDETTTRTSPKGWSLLMNGRSSS